MVYWATLWVDSHGIHALHLIYCAVPISILMVSRGTAFDGLSGACFAGFLGAGAGVSSTLVATATAGRGCILAGVDGRVS